jgi:predicted Rossmann fold nucleotide-binding protein DprA/Smf involved in DNA uptake
VLVACPREEHGEETRSGTWSTVRYARRVGRPVIVVRPSGRIERECYE